MGGLREGTSKDVNIPSVFNTDKSLGRVALRKLDLVLVPTLALFYFLSFLDRSNLGTYLTWVLKRAEAPQQLLWGKIGAWLDTTDVGLSILDPKPFLQVTYGLSVSSNSWC